MVSNEELSLPSYWDWVAESSFHIRMKNPTITDVFYRHIVLEHIRQARSGRWGWVLKLDAYNEATHTQYGFHIMDHGAELVMVDISIGISSKAAQKAKVKGLYASTHLIVADFRQIPLRDDAVDMSCSFGSIEHVPEYVRAFYEQVRVVKKGGWVFVGVPNLANWSLRYLSVKLLSLIGVLERITNPERHFTGWELKRLAEYMGLVRIEVTGYHLFPKHLRWLDLWFGYRGVNATRNSRLFRWLLRAFTIIESRYSFVRLFAEMLLVKGVKKSRQGIEGKSSPDEAQHIIG